jgi:hypothetical protein
MASLADGEEILALSIVGAALERGIILAKPIYAATHEDMRTPAGVGLDLNEALIHPIDAVAAIKHQFVGIPFCVSPILL